MPTPWTTSGRLDAAALEENIQRYKAFGVPGVYTTDSDGEFYAIELAEFQSLARIFARAVEKTSMDAAIGVTWSHTAGIIDRIKTSLDAGIPNVHVGFPFWMPLAKPDLPRFFEDLANAVPDARWIHYRTPRCHILLTGAEYAHYQRMYPDQFVGTKLGTHDISDITKIIVSAKELSHFATELSYVPAALAGARGLCSFWVNTLPEWTLETWRLCEESRWEEAMQRQAKLIRWEVEYMAKLDEIGYEHGIQAKARAPLTDFLVDSGVTRAPYYPVEAKLIEDLKNHFDIFWAGEKAQHQANGKRL